MNQQELKQLTESALNASKMADKMLKDITKNMTPEQALQYAKALEEMKSLGFEQKIKDINNIKWQ